MGYTVQQHGEWSDGSLDLDFEDLETLGDAYEVVRLEIPVGCIYIVIDEETGRIVEEATKRQMSREDASAKVISALLDA